MGYSPVDPASLSGDALDRWYRRTPDEIERDRRTARQASYDAFFGQSSASGQSIGDGGPPIGSDDSGPPPVRLQLASAQVGCPTCHVGAPPPPLIPFPWSVISAFQSGNGGAGSGGSSHNTPKQCVVQEQSDEEFCRRPTIPIPRRECWSRTNQRWGHCRATDGEVGHPPLVRPDEWRPGPGY